MTYSELAKEAFTKVDKSFFDWIYFYVDNNEPATVVFDSTFTLIFFAPFWLGLSYFFQLFYNNPSLSSSPDVPEYLRDDAFADQDDFRDSFVESSESTDNFDDENSPFNTVDGKPFDTSDYTAQAAQPYDEYNEKLTFSNRAAQYKKDVHIRRTRSILQFFISNIFSYLKLRRLYFTVLSFFMVISIIFGVAEWQPKSERLTNALRAKIALLKAMEIHNEKDPLVKLKALDSQLNSGGAISYTVLRDDDKNESERYPYVLDYNFTNDYVLAVKDLEEGYNNGAHTGIETAAFLEHLYSTGNTFIKKDQEKYEYYFYQKQAFKKALSGK